MKPILGSNDESHGMRGLANGRNHLRLHLSTIQYGITQAALVENLRILVKHADHGNFARGDGIPEDSTMRREG